MMALLLLACFGGSTEAPHEEHDAHEETGPTVLTLTPEGIEAARIVVGEAEVSTLGGGLELPARIALDPRKEAVVSAWIAGQVDTISVRSGDQVDRNALLARVQSPELGEAVAAFRTAVARDQAADARLERLGRLEADGVSSRAQVLEAEADHAEAEGSLEAAEERLRVLGVSLDVGSPHAGQHFPSRVPVRTPIAGTVFTTDVSVGERVSPGQALFHVGDLDEVWLLLDVYERDLGKVREGQQVRFEVEAWPERTFEGQVARVGDWIDPEARTVEVRVVVDNTGRALKPNMYATARLEIADQTGPKGVVVPVDAVQTVEGQPTVFTALGDGRFEARAVQVEATRDGRVQLASGLEAGERYVTEGAFALKSELLKGELGHGHAH